MYRKNCRKLTAAFLALILLIGLMPAPAFATTTGKSDGVYDFGGLGNTDSDGDGYVALGDKFRVPVGMYSATPSLGATTGDNTAIYFSNASTATAKILAEGTGSCGSFTFKDLGVSSFESERSLATCNLVLKDRFGTVLSDETLGASSPITTSAITNLSALYPSHGEWNVAGVSQIEITYTLSAGTTIYLTFENINIAGVSAKYLNAQSPTITGQPSGATVNSGGTANLTVAATGNASLSYQWYSNTTNSNSGGNLIGGATNATYSAPTTALGTTYYYCKVTNTDTGAINETAATASNTAAVVVNNLVNASVPTITAQPQDKALTTGQMTTISVTASVGSGSLTYQWYSNTTDSNLGGNAISGATGSTYSLTPASIGTSYYYCVVTNTDNSSTGNKTAATASDTASVSVTYGAGTFAFSGLNALADSCGSGYQKLGDLFKVPNGMYSASASLGASSGDKTAIYLSNASTTTAKILAEGTGSCGSFTFKDLGVSSYQSERSFTSCNLVLKDRFGTVLSNETLGASPLITTAAITNLSALYPSHGEWNVAGVSQIEITYTLSSNDITYLQFENIKMADISAKYLNAQAPTITSQPSGATVNSGGAANLTVAASGGVSLSYQWYSNGTNSNSGGNLIDGATNAAYSAPTTALGTIYYYCKVTNTDTGAINETAAKASNAAAVVVNSLVNASAPAITAQPQDKALTTGQMTTISVTASVGSGSLTYQWYSNTTDSNLGGNEISGATGSAYSLTPASIGTTFYYCVVTNTDNSVTGNKTSATASDTASVSVTYGAGTFAFSGLNALADSCGSGYQKLGDLFKVPNSMYSASASLGAPSGDKTAIYLSSASTATAKILAEGTGSCGAFTFKDLGVSSYQSERSFTSCNLVLKDRAGTVLSNETLGASSPITASAITNLSALFPSHGEWNVAGVSQIEITYTLSSNDITYLQLEYIKIVDISNDAAPTVTTGAISDKTSTSAVLNGIVNANDASTVVTFEYGTTVSYGASAVAAQSPVSGTTETAVSCTLTGLTPNTTYHYRVVGTNSGGTTNGSDMTFTTSAVTPTVTTSGTTGITSTGATLNGSANANNASTTVTFEYGTTTAYGSSATASQSPASGMAPTAVSAALTGLSPNTTYHYRAVGVNTAGTTQGTDGTFTTLALPATVTTSAVTSVSGTGATLNGSVNANNSNTTVSFQYGTTTSYGASATASQSPATGTTATAVSCTLTGLTPNTTYHYRIVAVNAAGTTNSSDGSFNTSAVPSTATTSAVTSITSNGAILNGSVNANNASTVVTFEYGTTTAYGSSATASQSPVSGTAPTAVSAVLTGLSPNTIYHYRVVGVNTAGTTNGVDGTFTTSAILYAVTINTNKDGAAAAAPGAVELKQGGATIYTATSSGTGTYTASAVDGTYDIFINGEDTNQNIAISGAANNATVNYYTVSFAVSNAGTAAGSTISATASSTAITSGAAVLAGKAVVITAAGAGASTYTYLWLGTGTSGQTTANLSIASLSSALNVACTVTGTTTSGSGNGSGGSGSSSNSSPTPAQPSATIIVNGRSQTAGSAETTMSDGKTVTTITIDNTKLDTILKENGSNTTVTIPSTAGSDVTVGVLNGQTVKSMEEKSAVLEIKTGSVTYALPASDINIDDVSDQIGQAVELKDIKISISIAEPPANTVKIVEDTANKNSYQIVVKPVEFEIACSSGSKTVDVSRFNGYVERTVAIPDGVDPSRITTGIVLNSDGTFSHVPTTIVKIDGKYYAKINSLTNSTYSVIYNSVKFADVTNHWAKESINNMGSRLIVTGNGTGSYNPNKDISRAEFAAIIVRALGLKSGIGNNTFVDVHSTDWYCGYTETAVSYGIISGYNATTFRPNDKITREQAMTMIARAMKLTGLAPDLKDSEVNTLLADYTDATKASSYAKAGIAACLDTEVVSGRSGSTIAPKNNITRAEVAVIVERLLKKSKLI